MSSSPPRPHLPSLSFPRCFPPGRAPCWRPHAHAHPTKEAFNFFYRPHSVESHGPRSWPRGRRWPPVPPRRGWARHRSSEPSTRQTGSPDLVPTVAFTPGRARRPRGGRPHLPEARAALDLAYPRCHARARRRGFGTRRPVGSRALLLCRASETKPAIPSWTRPIKLRGIRPSRPWMSVAELARGFPGPCSHGRARACHCPCK